MNYTHTNRKKALIIGCGIAGPVLAMFLQRAGITPTVYKRNTQPRDEEGFFLNLSPNGLAVLAILDLQNEVIEHGTTTTSIIFQNHNGKILGENPETTILFRRGILTKVLREAAIGRGVAIEFGKQLIDVAITPQQTVTAQFEDGSEAQGNLLVGCDGIHSQTRRSIMADALQPDYLGVIDSGGFARSSSVPSSDGAFQMTFGHKGFFGYQATPSGDIYWSEKNWESMLASLKEYVEG